MRKSEKNIHRTGMFPFELSQIFKEITAQGNDQKRSYATVFARNENTSNKQEDQ